MIAEAAEGAAPDGGLSSARERVLDAAAKMLCGKGFAGTRLSDIAAAAGVAVSTIYYDYASREDLFEEVVYLAAASMRQHLAGVLDGLPKKASPLERISVAVEAHLRRQCALADYALALARNVEQLPEPVTRRARVELAASDALWQSLIADLQSAGALRAGLDADTARRLTVGALSSAAQWPRGDEALERGIATAQSMILAALRK